ncbi:MAG TPA: EI24 domain-containing protein [Stellaceae bacterium]|nr:EI24 domain-containing protein [Stellaceae bacterium]
MRSLLKTLGLAFEDALAPAQRQALILSIVGAVAVFGLLFIGVTWGVSAARVSEHWWFRWPLEILGNLAVLGLAWLIFPGVATTILSLFLEPVLRRLERQHYPALPPALGMPLGAALVSGLRLLGLTIALNLLALPIYLLIPAINLLLFYLLNGYLLGREYFDLVALRRLDGVAAGALWRERRGRWLLAGTAIAALLSLPVVNLAAPLVAAALMLHLVTEAAGFAGAGAPAGPMTPNAG